MSTRPAKCRGFIGRQRRSGLDTDEQNAAVDDASLVPALQGASYVGVKMKRGIWTHEGGGHIGNTSAAVGHWCMFLVVCDINSGAQITVTTGGGSGTTGRVLYQSVPVSGDRKSVSISVPVRMTGRIGLEFTPKNKPAHPLVGLVELGSLWGTICYGEMRREGDRLTLSGCSVPPGNEDVPHLVLAEVTNTGDARVRASLSSNPTQTRTIEAGETMGFCRLIKMSALDVGPIIDLSEGSDGVRCSYAIADLMSHHHDQTTIMDRVSTNGGFTIGVAGCKMGIAVGFATSEVEQPLVVLCDRREVFRGTIKRHSELDFCILLDSVDKIEFVAESAEISYTVQTMYTS